MITVAAFLAAALLTSIIILFSKNVDANMRTGLYRASVEISTYIESLKTTSYFSARFFANDYIVMQTMGTERKLFLNRISQFLSETAIDFCGYVDDEEMGLLMSQRYRMTEQIKENIREMASIKYAFSRRWGCLTTIEHGDIVRLSVCTGIRVDNSEGNPAGAIVTGFRLDTEELAEKLKSLSGCEITVFIGDELIVTTLSGEARQQITHEKIPDNMIARHIPLKDYYGREMGVIVAGEFLTYKRETVRAFLITGIIVTIAILGISILLILFIVGRFSTPLNEMIEKIHYDSLTGIYNRRYIDESLNNLIRKLSRSGGTLSLFMIDIDFFKNYNDTYGHGAGDTCLKKIAATLRGCITRSEDFVARYGGEEFCAVLPNTTETGARIVAEKMLDAVRRLNIPHEKSDAADIVTISIGVVSGKVNHIQSADDYLKSADAMLYKSKNSGRNKYTFEP